MQDKIAQSERLAMQVSINSIIVNLILSVGKLAAGILANSAAMISDAVHSASDVFSTFIVMAGVKISNKASDAEHQYGHERLECVAAIILAIVLALTGIGRLRRFRKNTSRFSRRFENTGQPCFDRRSNFHYR